jgi:uncharacterized membrane protein
MYYLTLISTLSFFGMLDAGYLLYTRIAGVEIACGPVFHGCSTVAASRYSVLFGIPLSAWGLVFYVCVLTLVLSMRYQLLEKVRLGFVRPYVPQLLLVATTLGVVSSVYFIYLQAFVINAWCMYCVVSAVLSVSIFISTLLLLQKDFEK